jgi:altronate dehydratase
MENGDFLRLGGRKVALVLNERDNVAVVLAEVAAGDSCTIRGRGAEYELTTVQDVPFGHKVALAPIAGDEPIRKYGEVIGVATKAIPRGGWVHTHNLYCARGM